MKQVPETTELVVLKTILPVKANKSVVVPWKEPSKHYRIGKWFLAQRVGWDTWYRCGYNKRTRQTERVSLRTCDLQEAKRRLAEYFVQEQNPVKVPKALITLAKALTLYYTEHGKKVASRKAAKTHCEKILSYWKDSLLSEMNIREQRKFRDFLEEQGLSLGYIKRIFNTLRAAVNFCYKNEYIDQPVNMLTVSVPLHSNAEMGRPLSINEVVQLFSV